MVGIISYGAYIPRYRLSRDVIGKIWGGGGRGEKAVAYFDEDSITMAVAAVRDCLTEIDHKMIDGLYFASTTSPYNEKQVAAMWLLLLICEGTLLLQILVVLLEAGPPQC